MIDVFLKWSLEAFNATSDNKVCVEYSHKVIYPVISFRKTNLSNREHLKFLFLL